MSEQSDETQMHLDQLRSEVIAVRFPALFLSGFWGLTAAFNGVFAVAFCATAPVDTNLLFLFSVAACTPLFALLGVLLARSAVAGLRARNDPQLLLQSARFQLAYWRILAGFFAALIALLVLSFAVLSNG